ncbi:MAG: hypothetical protein ACTHM9_14235 [Gemmatimonadales bacterium]
MSSPARSPTELLQTLLDLHRECADAGLDEVAYHLLSAALHCAEASSGVEDVTRIIKLARAEQRRLDERSPTHLLSTRQAGLRGTTPLYMSLAATGEAMRTRIRAEAIRNDADARLRQRRSSAME